METFIVRDSEQDMHGQISHICTAKASLDGTIHWVYLDIIETNFPTALELGPELQRRRLGEYERLGMALVAGLGVQMTVRHVTIQEHLKWLCRVISQSGYRLPLLGHSLDRDIDFMFATDLGGTDKFFDGHPLKFPGSQRTSWQRIVKVCTQRLLTSCPLTFAMANPGVQQGTATLNHFTRALLGRDQQHNAVQDVIDLVEVLRVAHTVDRFRIPRENCLIIRPDNRVGTF